MSPKQAVDAIVTYATLPPQIDYTRPWAIKAHEAEEYLQSLGNKQFVYFMMQARDRIDEYYTPTSNGYSVAEMDAMF